MIELRDRIDTAVAIGLAALIMSGPSLLAIRVYAGLEIPVFWTLYENMISMVAGGVLAVLLTGKPK